MFEAFSRLPENYQGIISLIVGTALLCYTLDLIIPGINLLVIALALYLIGIGFIKSGLYRLIINTINRFQRK